MRGRVSSDGGGSPNTRGYHVIRSQRVTSGIRWTAIQFEAKLPTLPEGILPEVSRCAYLTKTLSWPILQNRIPKIARYVYG